MGVVWGPFNSKDPWTIFIWGELTSEQVRIRPRETRRGGKDRKWELASSDLLHFLQHNHPLTIRTFLQCMYGPMRLIPTGWFFLTGPPNFQYQNEKRWAANQRFCSMKFSMYKRSLLAEQRFYFSTEISAEQLKKPPCIWFGRCAVLVFYPFNTQDVSFLRSKKFSS